MSIKGTLITLVCAGVLAGVIGTTYGASKKAQEYANQVVNVITKKDGIERANVSYSASDFTKTLDAENPKGKVTVRLYKDGTEDIKTPFWVTTTLVSDSTVLKAPVITASSDHAVNGDGLTYGYTSGVSFTYDFSASTAKVSEWLGYLDVVTKIHVGNYEHKVGERYIPLLQGNAPETSLSSSAASV